MKQLLAILLLLAQLVFGLPALSDSPKNTVDEDLNSTSNSNGLGGLPMAPIGGSKCSTGCGIGIGLGCLVGVVLFSFIFVMARRHKRKMHNTWVHRKWLSKQKALPDKPVPAPPPPTKF
ncbi:hypothetical protein LPJ60_006437 [Coemansia sp. RSA 2675]|uniref:Transmembrane protein n=2 Tax=Coemansia TaxID=4863 RepID=A0A9W8L4F8_9FUNG|nr:hypothetical protein LPJ60_006437 [Coemansia sp. RSA 2675]KAJ2686930.1 hypothetical protein IWW39_003288 [Coemansia spiralis]KAJ2697840.1 hypothetical protein H4218_003663 [Coemansia sp. IMI 209128]KAJ2791154.1 hypothetical protein GGI18_001339 [Coemansia linderi]